MQLHQRTWCPALHTPASLALLAGMRCVMQQVPTAHGKADLTLYRSQGKRVLDILARLAKTERASIDECYLDLTAEAQRRLEACAGVPALPCNAGG